MNDFNKGRKYPGPVMFYGSPGPHFIKANYAGNPSLKPNRRVIKPKTHRKVKAHSVK